MLVFDLETDGLLDDLTTIHCLSIYDTETTAIQTYNDQGSNEPTVRGIQRLEDADAVLGHNIIGFDLCAISKLYPWFRSPALCIDTLILSRLYHPHMLEIDAKRKIKGMPTVLYGRHSLESYGWRLGMLKGDYGKNTDWKEWTQELQDYCELDVQVTNRLWNHFSPYLNQHN